MSHGVHLAAILDFVIRELRKLIISITFEPSDICDICCVAYIWRQIVLSDDFLVTLEHDVTRVVMTSHEY